MVTIRMSWLQEADPNLGLPQYETSGAAGADLRANFPDRGNLTVEPGGRALIPTGLRIEIPAGYEAQVRPRSGLALKYGITLANSPGTIDSDYRGALGVILLNTGPDLFQISHGDRIAQLVVSPMLQARFETGAISDTHRGSGGFGSTGTN